MPTVLSIIDALASNNSRLFKEDLLKQNKDEFLLKEFFRLALEPHLQFYQRKIPNYTYTGTHITLYEAFQYLENVLATRIKTGHSAIEGLKEILSGLSPTDAKVVEKVIQKDPDCGVSDSTVNKIWPDLISSFPVLLCSPFDQKLVDRLHWKRGVYVQKKEDGARVNVVIRNKNVSVFSRNGRLFDVNGVFDYLASFVDNVVIDGELLVKGGDGKFLDRKTGNGICSKALKGTIKPKDCDNLFVNAWDIIPFADFQKGICVEEYESRYTKLFGLMSTAFSYDYHKNVGVVETQVAHDFVEAEKIFQQYIDAGDEGVILKDKSAIWEDKRSKQLIKMKSELDCDLVIVDVQEGTGKYSGQVGALVCADRDGIVNVNVGSGLNDDQRKNLNKKDLIGKIVAVTYNQKIQAKDGTWSLFLPRVLEIREDKYEADTFNTIK